MRNGLEEMSSGEKLTIRTFKDANEVVLTVSDQGKGIEKKPARDSHPDRVMKILSCIKCEDFVIKQCGQQQLSAIPSILKIKIS